jgi:branched-chain amino acid transport system ATP-binding protein
MQEPILTVNNVHKYFGGVVALNGVSLDLKEGEIFGLIGPNGSGKTTLVNTINGFYPINQGKIFYKRKRIDGFSPDEIARMGVGRTFQLTKTFNRMSVIENMMVPALAKPGSSPKAAGSKALAILKSLRIEHLREEYGRNLSGGQQKLLEFGKMLMLDPIIVLLDEPFAGVHPNVLAQMHENILQLKEEKKSVILVSHAVRSIFTLCDRIMVLDKGEKIMEGTAEQVKTDERVIHAYLGE